MTFLFSCIGIVCFLSAVYVVGQEMYDNPQGYPSRKTLSIYGLLLVTGLISAFLASLPW